MFLAPVLSRTSLSATIAVHAGIPVAPVIRSQSRTSRSKPSHPDEVPFQAITLTLACASSSAAARISVSSNCASAGPDSAISVTLKREKCAVTSGRPAIIAVVTGSRIVLEDGVSIPRKTRSVINNSVCRARAHWSQSRERPSMAYPLLEGASAREPLRVGGEFASACMQFAKRSGRLARQWAAQRGTGRQGDGSQDFLEGHRGRGRAHDDGGRVSAGRRAGRREDLAFRSTGQSGELRSNLGHAVCRAECCGAGVGYALRV